MPKRNVFISYKFHDDLAYKKQLDAWLSALSHKNYSLSNMERTDEQVAAEIRKRPWSFSLVILLVGKRTHASEWIWRELFMATATNRSLQHHNPRRVLNPKGILVVMLPGRRHKIPKPARNRLREKTAVRIDWNDLDSATTLDRYLHEAYAIRPK